MTRQEKLNRSLDNALENGYEILNWSDEEIAIDLGTYDADFEGAEISELVPMIQAWRESRK